MSDKLDEFAIDMAFTGFNEEDPYSSLLMNLIKSVKTHENDLYTYAFLQQSFKLIAIELIKFKSEDPDYDELFEIMLNGIKINWSIYKNNLRIPTSNVESVL